MEHDRHVTPEELRAILAKAYGYQPQRQFAADIDVSEVTVSRWVNGVSPLGGTETTLVRLIDVLAHRGYPWRKWLQEYRSEKHIAPKKRRTLEDML